MSIYIFTKRLFSFLFIYFLSNGYFFPLLFAQNTTANLGTGFSVEICKESSFSIKDINNQSCFKETSLSELSKEKYPDKVWLKITVTDTTQKFILFDKVDSIKAHFDNRIFLTGNLVAQSQKQVLTSRIINAIQIPIYQNPFYVELSPSKKLPFSAKIDFLTETDFTQNYVEIRQNDILLHAVFQGMLWIILLYNFFLFIASKERVYLAYSVYVLGFSIFNAQNTGFLGDFFIAEYPSLSILVRIIGLTLIFIGNTFFAILFLPSYTISKAWLKYFTFVWMLVSVLTFVYIFLYYGLENEYIYTIMSKIIHGIIMLTFLIFFANLARKYWSDTMIKYFLIGSAMVVMGASIYNVLSSLGIKNSGIVVQVGGIAEILIFSLGLGYRMKKLEKENARILENQNKILEQRVTERTREISIKQEEILVQNEELQQQQEEIISQRDYIETQNKQLKHTNTQFTDSVRYAKTIQKAILPLKERVQNYFEDSFVLFRPRDIVSGDFYWFYEATDPQTQEEVILLAVLDCTGHGVPGAFISLIGFAILNEIVAKEDLISPSEILIRLDERIQESLRQKQTQNLDGMDVALCAIRKINTTNSENFEVKFSGAKRPLYFIKDNQFEELKGTKLSIGGITRKKISDKYHFEEQTIILSKNDKIYLTSDGFADQNGYNRQKIGSSQLKDYFDEFHHLPFAEQRKKFEEILDNHQGKQKQRDDITILGLKL